MFINDCLLGNDEDSDVSLDSDSDSDNKEEEVNDNIYNKMFINDCNYEVPDVSSDSDSDNKEEEVNDNILLYFLKKQLYLYFFREKDL